MREHIQSAQEELGNVQKEAEAKLKEKLAEYSGATDEQFSKFTDIAKKLKDLLKKNLSNSLRLKKPNCRNS